MADHSHHHAHGEGHSHAHGHGHGDDYWDGDAYLARPGVQESGKASAENVIAALEDAGVSPSSLSKLNLLEVGCGPGAVTQHLAKIFGTVHAIDMSANMLRTFAQQPVAQLDTVTWGRVALSAESGDEFAKHTPFPSPTPQNPERKAPAPRERFDVAVANLVVHHVDDMDGFFKGVSSLLVPGGYIVITEFTLAEDGTDVVGQIREKKAGLVKPDVEGTVNAPGHLHPTMTLESLTQLLGKYGFTDIGGARGLSLPVFGPEFDPAPCVYVYARRP